MLSFLSCHCWAQAGPVGSDSLCLVTYSSAVDAFVYVDIWELEVTHLTWYGALPEQEQCFPEQSRLGFLSFWAEL